MNKWMGKWLRAKEIKHTIALEASEPQVDSTSQQRRLSTGGTESLNQTSPSVKPNLREMLIDNQIHSSQQQLNRLKGLKQTSGTSRLNQPVSSSTSCKTLKEEPGLKYDAGKPRHDLVPPRPMDEVAKVMTLGAVKYGDHNWRKGLSVSRYLAALQRHVSAYSRADKSDLDDETGLHHLAHAICCALMIMDSAPKWDDRYKGEEDGD